MKNRNDSPAPEGCTRRLVRLHRLWRDAECHDHANQEFARLGLPVPAIRKIGMFWLRWIGEGDMPPRLSYPDGPGWPKYSGQLQPYHSAKWEFMGQHNHPDASALEILWIWMNENTCRAHAGIEGIGLSPETDQHTLDASLELSAEVLTRLANTKS